MLLEQNVHRVTDFAKNASENHLDKICSFVLLICNEVISYYRFIDHIFQICHLPDFLAQVLTLFIVYTESEISEDIFGNLVPYLSVYRP